MNTEFQILSLGRWSIQHPTGASTARKRIDILSDRWLTGNSQHTELGGPHRPHSKRHPKHSRGNSNRPIADSMDATPGDVLRRRS